MPRSPPGVPYPTSPPRKPRHGPLIPGRCLHAIGPGQPTGQPTGLGINPRPHERPPHPARCTPPYTARCGVAPMAWEYAPAPWQSPGHRRAKSAICRSQASPRLSPSGDVVCLWHIIFLELTPREGEKGGGGRIPPNPPFYPAMSRQRIQPPRPQNPPPAQSRRIPASLAPLGLTGLARWHHSRGVVGHCGALTQPDGAGRPLSAKAGAFTAQASSSTQPGARRNQPTSEHPP